MKCIICETASDSFEDFQLKKEFFQCPKCQLIFLNPSQYVNSNQEKSQYENHNNDIANKGYVKMFEDFMKHFLPHLKNHHLNALDFGCGPGPVLATLLEQKGFCVRRYDPFFYPEKIKKTESFSLITATEVFEHLHNPLTTFSKLLEHLQEGGILALMTLFHQNDKEYFLKWWYRRDPTHVVFYTPKTFEYLANIFGLEILTCDDKRVIVMQKK